MLVIFESLFDTEAHNSAADTLQGQSHKIQVSNKLGERTLK